jgi:hypothetical protein
MYTGVVQVYRATGVVEEYRVKGVVQRYIGFRCNTGGQEYYRFMGVQ